ncbi:Gfo/Idh/MocA family oxidoreductase [Sphingobacteriaceae bacterium WQ 2009]|uniref:Gfo/Idh/MocA family oxidoreductase n=1 Tax=Rhinopithecimicrobium faecis TaxID=2820698 RepID=A0A8T4H9L9_9SPHI|nr:Gfo/Idh/MocA family oxidoreductase [Sphingobacteriaceae bacterium WQ 2009]
MDRRNFIKNTAVAAAGLGILSSTDLFAQDGKIKLGFIGVGLRGRNHVQIAINRPDVEIVAICDTQEESLVQCRKQFAKAGAKAPKEYTGGLDAYKRMLSAEKLDAIIIATPWEFHKDQAVDSMRAGLYVGCEVIAGLSVKDHWEVVRASEETGKPYMTLENVAYRRDVLAVLNMHRQGLFGELLHLEGGYQHDLREVLFNDGKSYYGKGVEFGPKAISEAQWRTQYNLDQDGDLYPTHGLGPIIPFIDINKGNRFTHITSYSSKARGLASYVNKKSPGHPNSKLAYKNGDITQTMLQCANGETVLLTHDTHLPRPYSIGFRVQGTEGIWMDVAQGIHIEGKSKPHAWDPAKEWVEKYDHPIWKKYEELATGSGHGGMDWFVFNGFIQAVKQGKQTPFDVYDSVTMSAVFPLSTESIKKGNKTLVFPDFTRGKWKTQKNTFMLDDSGL